MKATKILAGLILLFSLAMTMQAQAAGFMVKFVDGGDNSGDTNKVVVGAKFTHDEVVGYMANGLSMPLSITIESSITQTMLYSNTHYVEFTNNMDSHTPPATGNYNSGNYNSGKYMLSYDMGTQEYKGKFMINSASLNIPAGEDYVINYQLDWSGLCGCAGRLHGKGRLVLAGFEFMD